MRALGNWFRTHWFVSIFMIITLIWTATLVAWLAGAREIRFGNRYGPPATIDFMREHDRPTLAIGETAGLVLAPRPSTFGGSLISVEPGPAVLCLVCGYYADAGGIANGIEYRNGDWFYRGPRDESHNSEAQRGRQESRDFILTIAYNGATGERVIVGADDTLEQQAAILAERGLSVSDDDRLSAKQLSDLRTLSMTSEGCVIFNLAFVAAALLWLVFGGLAALFAARRRRSRGRNAAAG